MSALNKVSSIVSSQLPQFIREDHPLFVEFLEKYYEFLELPGNPIYEIKRFDENFDVNLVRESLLKYFKSKILPSFPDSTALSTEKIIKASRDFYAKKGTADSFKFLFRVLYGQEVEVYFPKLQILKASDGKWVSPQAFRLTISNANLNFDVNLIEKRKGYGSISKASCRIETANKTIDPLTGREIFEIYVTDVNRLFSNGEFLEVEYTDSNGQTQIFSEKIIGALSNIRINPRRRGRKYQVGDPVVINGGQDPETIGAPKAVAIVSEVTAGSIDSVTVFKGGYGFRNHPNTLVDVITAKGVGANIIVSAVDSSNVIEFSYCTDAILYKANSTLDAADYAFDNIASANINTTLNVAFTYEKINLFPIQSMTVVNGGSFFDEEPVLNPVSLYDSDYSLDEPTIELSPGDVVSYNPTLATLVLSSSSGVSTQSGWYIGWRVLLEKQFRQIIAYDGTTRTITLDRKFEENITATNILTRTLYLDPRPNIQTMGRIAAVEIINGGSGYSGTDPVEFVGTGYGAAATISVDGSGSITSVAITNRGEGYPIAPSVVVSSSGTGAILKAVLYGDGEDLDVITSDIGQIRNISTISRGSDYVSTPNISLKVYDIVVTSPGINETILENDVVFQGADINTASFKAIVDSFNPANNMMRVFDYSGSPLVGTNLTIQKSSSANVNVLVRTANVDGRVYPYRYGDGKARANAEFLNGLIRFNGYYSTTDGHLSSDRYLQDDKKYQNFSYSLVSPVQYKDYGKTILDVAHPAGARINPVFDMKKDFLVVDNSNSNVHITTTLLTSNVISINVDYESVVVLGSDEEEFDLLANVNDLIVINSGNDLRSFTKGITYIANNKSLNIESVCVLVGQGRAKTNSHNANIAISGNTAPLTSFISTTDKLKINIGGNIIVKTINSISGNIITLNSNTGIETSNSNLLYEVYPKFENVYYKIIKTDI